MKKRLSLGVLFILGLLLIVFHENILEFVQDIFGEKDPRPVIATLDEFSGTVNYKLPKTLVYKKVRKSLGLRDQDTLVTDSESSAIITFVESNFKLEVAANSVIVIEQPQAGEDGIIRITFLRGDFRVLNEGIAGKLIVAKDNELQDPAGRKPAPPIKVAAVKPKEPEPTPEPAPVIKAEVIEDIKPIIKPKPEPPPKKKETLSDEYIAQIIRQQTRFFDRCYKEHLRLNPKARGRLNLSFTITSRGEVSSVRLLGSTLKDPKLEQCAMSVVERARFKKFDGDPIIVNYPINFE